MKIEDIPWPVAGEPLIRDDLPDWQNNACFDPFHSSLATYSNGFRHGATELVKVVISGHGIVDYLVFPIIFLYRHAVEVALKELIRSASRLLDTGEDFETHHNLDKLWKVCRPLLEKVDSDVPTLDAVAEKIQALHDLDPDSFHFRYPEDKKGKRTLPEDLVRVNVRHFAEQVDQVLAFLEAAGEQISVHLDYKREMNDAYGL